MGNLFVSNIFYFKRNGQAWRWIINEIGCLYATGIEVFERLFQS